MNRDNMPANRQEWAKKVASEYAGGTEVSYQSLCKALEREAFIRALADYALSEMTPRLINEHLRSWKDREAPPAPRIYAAYWSGMLYEVDISMTGLMQRVNALIGNSELWRCEDGICSLPSQPEWEIHPMTAHRIVRDE